MSSKFKIYTTTTFGLKSYEAKIVKHFLGRSTLEINIDGGRHYIVAYLKKDSYHPIKEILDSFLRGLIGQTVYYNQENLNKKYLDNLNKYQKVFDELVKNSELRRLGRKKIEEMALKQLGLKENQLKSIKITKIELI
jgi:hypothetical protein